MEKLHTKAADRFLSALLFSALLAATFASCANATGSGATSATNGSISVSVPAAASWIVDLRTSQLQKALKGKSARSPGAGEGSKAIAYVSKLVVTVKDSSGVVVGSATIDPSASGGLKSMDATSAKMPEGGTYGLVSNIAAGSGYAVLVDGYNTAMSTTVPVVQGGTGNSIEVTAGGTAHITLNCSPATSPLLKSLDLSTIPASTSLTLPASGEQWYALSLVSGTTYYFSQDDGNFGFCLFNSNGANRLASDTSYMQYTPSADGTYYLAVASIASGTTESTTLSVSTTAASATAEGASGSPIALTLDGYHHFLIPGEGYSYYSFTTGDAGSYALEIGSQDYIDYGLFSDAGFSTPVAVTRPSGYFYQGTQFSGLDAGTTYYLRLCDDDENDLIATGRVASPGTINSYVPQCDGSRSSPLGLALGTPRSGSVGYHYYDKVSYYGFTTGSGIDYDLSLSGATGYVLASLYSASASALNKYCSASPSADGLLHLQLNPTTTYYLVLQNQGAGKDSPPTAAYTYTIGISAADPPSFQALGTGPFVAGSNSATSDAIWYKATVNEGDTYLVQCDSAYSGSSTYTAYATVDAYQSDRLTSYFSDYRGYSSSTFAIASGQSTLYICVHNCKGSYALKLIDVSTTGTINITAY